MTYRLLSASQDSYITDRYIAGSRSLDANVGQAGTLDLFKLFNATVVNNVSGNIVELSRVLLKFDYSELTVADVSNANFTASLVLKDVYGGQTVPTNFTLALYPVSKSWDEGRGFDVISYRDIDTVNFLSASTTVTWSVSGADDKGNLGADVDVIVSGDIGSGVQGLGVYQTFTRGDEDARFDVTQLVSASVVGILENHGFRLSYTDAQETDSITRFVKRFGSRHTFNKELQPKIHVQTVSRIRDTSGQPKFNVSQSFYTYNTIAGNKMNFVSASVEITGSDSLLFEVAASKSISFVTQSFQANFSSSITHTTRSVVYFSQSFSASQDSTGTYKVDFMLDLTNNTELLNFVNTGSVLDEVSFHGQWKSLDGTVVFAKDFYTFTKPLGEYVNLEAASYVVNASNLQEEYSTTQLARIRVFAQNRGPLPKSSRIVNKLRSSILEDMRWRLKKAYKNEVVIPFTPATKMSTDNVGMYFDLYMQDLDINEVYELEFLIKNDLGKDVLIQNQGFIFKVVA